MTEQYETMQVQLDDFTYCKIAERAKSLNMSMDEVVNQLLLDFLKKHSNNMSIEEFE